MSTKPYRFLLRMPQELRLALTERAQRDGRSLNAQILELLEASFDQADADTQDTPRRVRRARVVEILAWRTRATEHQSRRQTSERRHGPRRSA